MEWHVRSPSAYDSGWSVTSGDVVPSYESSDIQDSKRINCFWAHKEFVKGLVAYTGFSERKGVFEMYHDDFT